MAEKIGAWKFKTKQSFYCNECHKKWSVILPVGIRAEYEYDKHGLFETSRVYLYRWLDCDKPENKKRFLGFVYGSRSEEILEDVKCPDCGVMSSDCSWNRVIWEGEKVIK